MEIIHGEDFTKDGLKVYVVKTVFDDGYEYSDRVVGICSSLEGAQQVAEAESNRHEPPFEDYHEEYIQITPHNLLP